MSCGVGCRSSLDPVLLWLGHRPVAIAPIRPLAWEPPHAVGVVLEKRERQKKKKKCFFQEVVNCLGVLFLQGHGHEHSEHRHAHIRIENAKWNR